MNGIVERLDGSSYERVGLVETAKLVRSALKGAFPGQKFSVTTERFAGGTALNVRYEDGPSEGAVEAVVNVYRNGGFDGMIDLKYDSTAWLHDDGTVTYDGTSGTQGSMGVVPATGPRLVPRCARRVMFGASYLSVDRSMSAATKARLHAKVAAASGAPYNEDAYYTVTIDGQEWSDYGYAIVWHLFKNEAEAAA